jgi:RimJ/RimL family protein N-acetyltransferase
LNNLAVVPQYAKTQFRRMSFKDGDFARMRGHHNFIFVGDMVGIIAELDGEVIGAATFGSFSANSCFMHLWIGNPVAFYDGILEAAFNLAFVEMGVGIVIARLYESNTKVVGCAKTAGFELVFRLKDGAGVGDDYLFYALKREDCKYLSDKSRS